MTFIEKISIGYDKERARDASWHQRRVETLINSLPHLIIDALTMNHILGRQIRIRSEGGGDESCDEIFNTLESTSAGSVEELITSETLPVNCDPLFYIYYSKI